MEGGVVAAIMDAAGAQVIVSGLVGFTQCGLITVGLWQMRIASKERNRQLDRQDTVMEQQMTMLQQHGKALEQQGKAQQQGKALEQQITMRSLEQALEQQSWNNRLQCCNAKTRWSDRTKHWRVPASGF